MEKKKILVLETDKNTVESYRACLENEYSLLIASTNKEARFKTDNELFSVIIAEITLLDGSATATILRFRDTGQNRNTPILLISEFGESVMDQFAGVKGVFFLKKNVSANVLIEKIKGLITSVKKEFFIDVKIINPIIAGTVKTLETMAGIVPEPGKPYIKQKSEVSGDISGVVGVTSSSYDGSIALSFYEPLFLQIVTKMLGEECNKIDEGTKDAVAELINIIFGQAKKLLSEEGYSFEKAIPSIVTGKGHVIDFQSTLPVVVIPFKTSLGDFRVEVCASERKKKN